MKKIGSLSLLIVLLPTIVTLASCSTNNTDNKKDIQTLKLVEEPNPVEAGGQLSRVLFKDLYKSGVAVSTKEFMESGRKNMSSGQIPVGSGISPQFYARNIGGPFKGLHLKIGGSAIDQKLLTKPEVIINSVDGQKRLTLNQYVGSPSEQVMYGTTSWIIDAPNFEINTNDQINIAMNCTIAKSGTSNLVFTIYPSNDRTNALISHNEAINIRSDF